MKKVLALIIAAMMIVSMIPVMAITSSAADVDGDWITYRFSDGYKEPEPGEEPSYTPAPGFEYNDEGFHMTSADYTGITPSGTIQSKDKVNIKDGVYMELRIDQYPYGGEKGVDHWICFSIMDSQKVHPGNTTDGYGQGWQSLCRTPGNGGAGPLQSFVVGEGTAGWMQQTPDLSVAPATDENGKEIYTFEIAYDGSNYTISIGGVVVSGCENITKHLNSLNPNGEFYIGVSFHAAVADAPMEATMLKFGTSKETAEKPVGSDSALPEENINVKAPIADSSKIETNMPCLLFDATGTSYAGEVPVSGLDMSAQGDNSFKVAPAVTSGYFTWNIRNSLSYEASDFPVIGFFMHDPNEILSATEIYYCAGENMSAGANVLMSYSIYDEANKHWGENEEYTFVVIDMKEMLGEEGFAEGWSGRINNLRFDFRELYLNEPVDPETDYFTFHYAGIFRSVEEAYAYQDAYAEKLNLGEAATEEPTEEPTD
ncbi:MAG: hypothetical protein IJW00_11205, partial [Clostridia bacterium]|nr:hypothetical protein [Clostridia bacterium]